jgi:hypothetical protein
VISVIESETREAAFRRAFALRALQEESTSREESTMNRQKRTHVAFRPSVGETRLEDRVVLSVSKVSAAAIHSLVVQPTPAPSPFTPLSRLTAQQVRNAFMHQSQVAAGTLRNTIRNDIIQLFATGRPTAQQLSDFNATVAGQLDASALRMSSQALLLPGRSQQLVTTMQNFVLGSNPNSLLSRIQAITQSPRFINSAAALRNAISVPLNRVTLMGNNQLNNFFNTTALNRLSVDSTGQQIPLQQFFGQQVMSQLGNSLGSLGQSFSNQANTLLFPTNGITPTTAAVNAFNNQFSQALNTSAFQLASNLALFNGGTGVLPQVQNSLFGSGSGALFNTILGIPNQTTTNAANFASNISTAFNNGFGTLNTPLSNFFGINPTPNTLLPTSNFPNIFGPTLAGATFNSGFNNGFGSGFIGFGTAPNAFNTNFGTGFNTFMNDVNQSFGVTPPPAFPTGITMGTGTVV